MRRRIRGGASACRVHAPERGTMDGHDTDDPHARALALAELGWGHVSPNPMVGAVVLAGR